MDLEDEQRQIVRGSSEESQESHQVVSTKEVVASALISAFCALIGLGGLIYGAAIAEPQDALKIFGNLLGVGFLIFALIFLIRTSIEYMILGAAQRKEFKTLQTLILTLILLDIPLMLAAAALVFWLEIYTFLPILLLIVGFDLWRQRTLIVKYFCRNNYTISEETAIN